MARNAAARVIMAGALFILGTGSAARAQSAASSRPAPKRSVFTIVNKTDWDIHGIHLTPAEEDTWSENRLKGKVLARGARVRLRVTCEEQDVKLVDGHGKTCVSESMYPCDRHATWTLTNRELAGCATFGR
jgi:hypothetical protein